MCTYVDLIFEERCGRWCCCAGERMFEMRSSRSSLNERARLANLLAPRNDPRCPELPSLPDSFSVILLNQLLQITTVMNWEEIQQLANIQLPWICFVFHKQKIINIINVCFILSISKWCHIYMWIFPCLYFIELPREPSKRERVADNRRNRWGF